MTSGSTVAVDIDIEAAAGLKVERSAPPLVLCPSRSMGADPYEVQWDGPDDPQCPLNKPAWRKW